jgi:serine/threonine protein kinase
MPRSEPLSIDVTWPALRRYTHVRWLEVSRRQAAGGRPRHHLFIGREKDNPVDVLIKVTSRAGRVYEDDIENEWRSLTAINLRRPDSRYFPFVHDQGRFPDGRRFLITSLFDEFPLATITGAGRVSSQLVEHLRIAIELARAIVELHTLGIVHVDLNPMNVLYRRGADRPTIRVVDFESSFEEARHAGAPYNPPITPGYSAPEVPRVRPDVRADVYSLAAVLYTLLSGVRWVPGVDLGTRIEADEELDDELRALLAAAASRDRDLRQSTMDVMLAELGQYLEHIWPGRRW